MFAHETTHRGHGFTACYKSMARLLGDDQVNVALAVFQLVVGQAVKFIGQGPQGFGQQAQFGAMNRQLTFIRFE